MASTEYPKKINKPIKQRLAEAVRHRTNKYLNNHIE